MPTITVFLKTPLFTFRRGGASHVPPATAALRGKLTDQTRGGFTVEVEAFLNDRGEPLDGPSLTLVIPLSKVDHAHLE